MDLEHLDQSKDQVDYIMEQYKRDLAKAEAELEDEELEAEGEGEYYEVAELEAEGDEDYEFMGFNNKGKLAFQVFYLIIFDS